MVAASPWCYAASVQRLACLACLVALAAAGACKKKSDPLFDPEDDPRRVIVDTEMVCTEISGGDVGRWAKASVFSATWQRLATRAMDGEADAICDAARLVDRRWRETKTCTPRLVAAMRERGGC